MNRLNRLLLSGRWHLEQTHRQLPADVFSQYFYTHANSTQNFLTHVGSSSGKESGQTLAGGKRGAQRERPVHHSNITDYNRLHILYTCMRDSGRESDSDGSFTLPVWTGVCLTSIGVSVRTGRGWGGGAVTSHHDLWKAFLLWNSGVYRFWLKDFGVCVVCSIFLPR